MTLANTFPMRRRFGHHRMRITHCIRTWIKTNPMLSALDGRSQTRRHLCPPKNIHRHDSRQYFSNAASLRTSSHAHHTLHPDMDQDESDAFCSGRTFPNSKTSLHPPENIHRHDSRQYFSNAASLRTSSHAHHTLHPDMDQDESDAFCSGRRSQTRRHLCIHRKTSTDMTLANTFPMRRRFGHHRMRITHCTLHPAEGMDQEGTEGA